MQRSPAVQHAPPHTGVAHPVSGPASSCGLASVRPASVEAAQWLSMQTRPPVQSALLEQLVPGATGPAQSQPAM